MEIKEIKNLLKEAECEIEQIIKDLEEKTTINIRDIRIERVAGYHNPNYIMYVKITAEV